MRAVLGHKGKYNVRVAVTGSGAHSSDAPSAVNAVQCGALLVAEIDRMARRLERDGRRDEAFAVPHSTAHVGTFHGGTVLNVVPERAELLFEVRTVGGDDGEALVGEIERFAERELLPRMRALSPQAAIDFDVYAKLPGLDNTPNGAAPKLALAFGAEPATNKAGFMTEAGLFQKVAGIDTVVVGPGSIDDAHRADESIAIEQLERCSAFISRLVGHAAGTAAMPRMTEIAG
jgi:acetylornithine deacetylase